MLKNVNIHSLIVVFFFNPVYWTKTLCIKTSVSMNILLLTSFFLFLFLFSFIPHFWMFFIAFVFDFYPLHIWSDKELLTQTRTIAMTLVKCSSREGQPQYKLVKDISFWSHGSCKTICNGANSSAYTRKMSFELWRLDLSLLYLAYLGCQCSILIGPCFWHWFPALFFRNEVTIEILI